MKSMFFIILLFTTAALAQFKKDKIELTGSLVYDSKIINSIESIDVQEQLYIENKKSPFLAGLMSAVLPGAGEVYSGNYWKAAFFVAVEAACIATNIIYSNKADEKTEEFKQFANTNWSVVRYAQWLNDYAGSLPGGEGAPKINIDPDENKAPWQRVKFSEVNAVEEEINTFSHKLVPYGEQQYYELIGKYHQYNHGWADSNPGTSEYYTNLSPMFHQYAEMHIEPDKIYQVASTAVVIMVTNHVLSALDAAWSTSRYNKRLKASIGLQERNHLGTIIYYPEFSLKVNF